MVDTSFMSMMIKEADEKIHQPVFAIAQLEVAKGL